MPNCNAVVGGRCKPKTKKRSQRMANDYHNMDDTIWENTRTVSDGSMTASNEQLALIGFVYRLGSLAVNNNESGIVDENDVRKEARLLMSLSCSSPMTIIEETVAESGRVTPQSDVSTCSGTSSRRSSFSFACPSLSLENHSQVFGDNEGPPVSKVCTENSLPPAVLLGRVLKVDDVDAMRLSSEAMARNIMESFQKAIEWRINTWVESLSQVLYEKEMSIKADGASEKKLEELLYTSEAKLLLQLQHIQKKIEVMDARTSFKVLPQRVTQANSGEPVTKRRRLEDVEDDVSGLEETEYQYEVAHALSLEVSLNMESPGAGYVQIDLQVPGFINGTFLSSEIESEILTDVMIELNTDILASMIEKSSRMVVRSSVQALLEQCEEVKEEKEGRDQEDAVIAKKNASPQPPAVTAAATTPKRSHSAASRPVFVTPQDSAPRTHFSGKDGLSKPPLLSIPDNFGQDGEEKRGLRMLSPQASKSLGTSTFSLQKRPSSLSREAPQLVTPLSKAKPSIMGKGKGPNLPVLVEVACAAMDAN